MTATTTDPSTRYHELKEARDRSRKVLEEIAHELTTLATDLVAFEGGIRVNEKYVSRAPVRPFKHVIGEERLPKWDRLAKAIRNHTAAEDAFAEHEADLDDVTRQRLGLTSRRR